MFEADSADIGARIFLLMSMRGGAEGLACADPVAMTPIGASENFSYFLFCQSVPRTYLGNVHGPDLHYYLFGVKRHTLRVYKYWDQLLKYFICPFHTNSYFKERQNPNPL